MDDFNALIAHLHRPNGFGHYWRKDKNLSVWWNGDGPPDLPTDRDLYFGVHPCGRIPTTNAQGKTMRPERVRSQIPHIAAINALFAEFDAKDFDGGKAAARAHIHQLDTQPSAIVDSGGGWHCYWLLAEPWLLTSEGERERARGVQSRWVDFVGGDTASRDLARVLRVPGTLNTKYDPPLPVRLVRCALDQLYNLGELDSLLPPAQLPPGGSRDQWSQAAAQAVTAGADRRRGAYAEKVLREELERVATAQEGKPGRNKTLNSAAYNLGQLVAEGLLEGAQVATALISAAVGTGLPQSEAEQTARSGLTAGQRDGRRRRMPDFEAPNSAAPAPAAPSSAAPDAPSHRGKRPTKEQAAVLNDLNCTDLGNAEALAVFYGETLRYCNTRERWLKWDGARWRLDEDGAAQRAVMSVAHGRYLAAIGIEELEKRKRVSAWAIQSENSGKIESALKIAGRLATFSSTIDRYDADPMLAATPTATLDLRTGTARPPHRDDYITMSLGTSYDPKATCPRWRQFLYEIFAGDEDLISYIQRAAGYCLTGDTREQKLFLCYGGGSNGKSRFLEVLTWLLGDYSTNAAFDTFDAGRRSDNSNDLAALKGRRLVTVIETEEDRRLAEARVKTVTGGDLVTARFLYGEFFSYKPQFKIWLAMNHKPIIRGTDRGIWRRIQLIPFTQSFEGRADMSLGATLQAELPGILNWALEGLRAWLSHGLGTSEAVQRATREYQEESDQVGRWLADSCMVGKRYAVGAAEAYRDYTSWCEGAGEKPLSQNLWGRRLTERGFTRKRNMRAWNWEGFGLIEERTRGGRETAGDDPYDPYDPDSGESSQNDSLMANLPEKGSYGSYGSSQASEPPPPGPLDWLPGARLVRCDHTGEPARYGIYWKVVGPGGKETDCDQHQGAVIAAARRLWAPAVEGGVSVE